MSDILPVGFDNATQLRWEPLIDHQVPDTIPVLISPFSESP
jgi:hypothetical protein